MAKNFDYVDIPNGLETKQFVSILSEARSACPNAIVCLRHTVGTDFPPFITVESPRFHDIANKNGEYELIMILPI